MDAGGTGSSVVHAVRWAAADADARRTEAGTVLFSDSPVVPLLGTLPRLKAAHVALASRCAHHHARRMFVITETDAATIRAVFSQEGELSAVIELRRRFPGVTDNAKARACARSIAGCYLECHMRRSRVPCRSTSTTQLDATLLARLAGGQSQAFAGRASQGSHRTNRHGSRRAAARA